MQALEQSRFWPKKMLALETAEASHTSAISSAMPEKAKPAKMDNARTAL